MSRLLLAMALIGLATSQYPRPQRRPSQSPDERLTLKYRWRHLEFDWPSEELRQQALSSGLFQPGNNFPMGAAAYKDRIFISVPRRRNGVPVTLTYISKSDTSESPVLRAYPDWETNSIPDENDKASHNRHIASVFRIFVDEKCDRLWFVDVGRRNDSWQIIQPKIVVINLQTDKIIRTHELRQELFKEGSLPANLVVEIPEYSDQSQAELCNEAIAYVADVETFGVIVYKFKQDRSVRVEHPKFRFDPAATNYTSSGVDYYWTDGVFGMAIAYDLTPRLYFHAMTSFDEFEVPTRVMHAAAAKEPFSASEFRLVGRRGVQSTTEIYDPNTNVLIYGSIPTNGVHCYSTVRHRSSEIARNSELFEFVADVTIELPARQVWVLANRLPAFIYGDAVGGFSPTRYNFHLTTGLVDQMVRGTPCDKHAIINTSGTTSSSSSSSSSSTSGGSSSSSSSSSISFGESYLQRSN